MVMMAFTIQVAGAERRLNWLQAPVTNVTKSFQKTGSEATLRSGKVLLRTEPLKSIFILHRHLG
jgi:hypothetical protein